MNEQNLSRRNVLSSIVVAGGAGALVGKGATSLFSDQETLSGGNMDASGVSVGAVDLDISIQQTGGTGIKYVVSLPEDAENNPAYLWVRASECPSGSSSFGNNASFTNDEALTVADALEVSLQVECATNGESDGSFGNNDGGFGNTNGGPSRSLLEVLNELRDGRRLLCGGEQCLQPDETLELIFEIESDDVSELPVGALDFELEFFAEQCRHNTATNPFGDLPDCGGPTTAGNAISFVAFRSSEKKPKVNITKIDKDSEGEPESVDWKITNYNDVDLDYVVVKAGQNFKIYDYRDDNKTSGTATNDESGAAFFGTPADFQTFDECPGTGNSGTGGGSNGNGGKDRDRNEASSCPCELAADEVGDGASDETDFNGTSAKLEWEKVGDGYEFVGENQ